eukprot:m.1004990 g.1004990  ORF g.1004990 m.1004990 type:complete len:174 (+) comp24048_c0_seq69:2322-2843(+)
MRAMAAYKWNLYHKHWFWGTTAFYIVQLTVVVWLSVGIKWEALADERELAQRTPILDVAVGVFAAMTAVDTVNECFQMAAMPFYNGFNLFCYFNDFWNVLDISRIASSITFTVLYFSDRDGARQMLAFIATIFWVGTLYYMLPVWSEGWVNLQCSVVFRCPLVCTLSVSVRHC